MEKSGNFAMRNWWTPCCRDIGKVLIQMHCAIIFLQIHGRRAKVHIDEGGLSDNQLSMMPWQGDKNNMIDR